MLEQTPRGISVPEVLATVELIEADDRLVGLPDNVCDEAIRSLLGCPDVAQTAHISMSFLRRTAEEQYGHGVLRKALNVVWVAGVRHGLDMAESLTEDVIETSVGNQMDLRLARLDDDEQRRVLGDLLDAHPNGPALRGNPYARRLELEAIVEAVGELLGVGNAS